MLDQANHIGNHQCTRVSVELKTSRSVVRLLEIQKTLQKQRYLFYSSSYSSYFSPFSITLPLFKDIFRWSTNKNGRRVERKTILLVFCDCM